MPTRKRWNVEVVIDENDGRDTYAEARLHTPDSTHVRGLGAARRNAADTGVPEIGDEVAAARALADLAGKLIVLAAGDIEAITHQPAHLRK